MPPLYIIKVVLKQQFTFFSGHLSSICLKENSWYTINLRTINRACASDRISPLFQETLLKKACEDFGSMAEEAYASVNTAMQYVLFEDCGDISPAPVHCNYYNLICPL